MILKTGSVDESKLMTAKNTDILLVSGSHHELENLELILTEEFGVLLKASSVMTCADQCKKHQPKVLVLALGTIEDSEQFQKELYDDDDLSVDKVHITLLLCRGKESKQAFDLCKRGVIDNYVAGWPLFDAYRLRISISQALDKYNQVTGPASSTQQIAALSEGLQQLDQYMKSQLNSGESVQRDFSTSFKTYVDAVSKTAGGTESNLEEGRKQMEDNLSKAQNWLSEVNEGYKSHLEVLKNQLPMEKPISVLLVDDDDTYREMIAAMLRDQDLEVDEEADGQDTLNHLAEKKPDVILLDYQIPGLDGLTVLREIKSHRETKTIPVIMLTGNSSRTVVMECMRAKASGYLVKPSDREAMLEKINSVLQAKQGTP